jgi:hypothetical protein
MGKRRKGVKDRYLGLRFETNGQNHFGWERLSVRFSKEGFSAILTGYAYETVPNKAIPTGKKKSAEDTAKSGTGGIENPSRQAIHSRHAGAGFS